MTLPVHLVPAGALDGRAVGDVVRLDGAEGRHAVAVRRTRAGERLVLADGHSRCVEGEVVQVGRDVLDLRVDAVREDPQPSPRFVLVQALAKGDRDDQAVEAATECGVDEVVPWQAARSIVRWHGERGEKARRKWDAVLVAATKQSRRTRRPVLAATASTGDIAARVRTATLALVLHEDATAPLAGVALPDAGDVVVVVGPEGGIAPDELAALEEAGARTVRLGPTVLRSSSAGPAALAVLSAAQRWR
ncbi:16S rRNA (uracil(1498)-N(3))-methyltransferase [Phycicoccus endophyticus]|uniref:Ribosomal RNA small subunit methyltransferase E n=1 Tax=Phycicoccus endophyticus TaxID=1690220 RepID=A0A7G9R3V4_9MICO|nr:16S rRNA (uracil(1498)-N(3))-methyltransferase [Phycicoccus endophyticus]NHI18109.1 16S rRNA (uracil(1498)-N(3))-methyltransferase [Phycicoccus endophyticus]QNN50279.1 16S rRNA (uracil(1498)-N(3))-methyltransferase [Phycicoccus endophyticus]GGL26332.1 ribosomal RNA small subunit methyltransferase E [Phycicoccus endophyticus]